MDNDGREQQRPEPVRTKEEARGEGLDPETRDRKATNDGQARRPNGVGESDDPQYRNGI